MKISGQGETIVFLHGALVSSAMWLKQIEYFGDSFRTIVVDMPEHGKSKNICLNEYTVQEISKVVLDTLDEKRINCFHLCGHSLGGMVAQEITLTQPDRVKGLVLAETSYGTNTTIMERTASLIGEIIMKAISQRQLIKMACRQYGMVSSLTREYIKKEMTEFNSKESRRIMNAALQYSSISRLNRIQNKTLILVSELNRQTHAQARRMSREINNSELIQVPNSHHLLNIDNPDCFNRVVERFLYNIV